MDGRAWMLVAAYMALLLAVHLWATRLTGALPATLHDQVGASAATVVSRWWAQWTALWFHNSWAHIGYNLLVLGLTMPVALHFFGPKALLVALLISPLAGYATNLLLLLPLSNIWPWAQAAVAPRLVGASVAIFAGAGLAWHAWSAPAAWKLGAVAGLVAYEVILAVLAVTNPFVAVYHLMGAFMGIGAGYALR